MVCSWYLLNSSLGPPNSFSIGIQLLNNGEPVRPIFDTNIIINEPCMKKKLNTEVLGVLAKMGFNFQHNFACILLDSKTCLVRIWPK